MHACMLSHFSRGQLFVTPWTAAHQAPLSMGFSRQGYWSGLPCPPPGDLLDPGVKSTSLTSAALASVSLPLTSPDSQACCLMAVLLFKARLYFSAAAESLQSCPTLCDPIDGSPPASPVPGILQGDVNSGWLIPWPILQWWLWVGRKKGITAGRLRSECRVLVRAPSLCFHTGQVCFGR